MKNVLKSPAKSVFIPLGLTTLASAADAGRISSDWRQQHRQFQTKNAGLLTKSVIQTIENENNRTKRWFS